jgi:hypothetical protein
MNPEISKSIKMKVFTANSLMQIAELYQWKLPPSWKQISVGFLNNCSSFCGIDPIVS